MNKKLFENVYSISKTLRFELKPVGATLENLKVSGILEKDTKKDAHRREIQNLFDENFKEKIEDKLNSIKFEEAELTELSKKDANYDKIKTLLKKQVIALFKEADFKKDYLKTSNHYKLLQEKYPDNKELAIYDKFTSYFTGFFDIRKYVFQGEDSGTIAARIIDDNLDIYLNNIQKIKKLPEDLKTSLDLSSIDNVDGFNLFISQKEITNYNEVLGGYTKSDGTKIQGINEKINLYTQKNHLKLPVLDTLYKMILFDQEGSSFVLNTIADDKELVADTSEFLRRCNLNEHIELIDLEHVYIPYKKIGYLPGVSYPVFIKSLMDQYDENYGTKRRRKTYEKDREKALKSDVYSLRKIQDILKDNNDFNLVERLGKRYQELFDTYLVAQAKFLAVKWEDIPNIKQSVEKEYFKDVLDSLKQLQRFYDLFEIVGEEYHPSPTFYNWLELNRNQLGRPFSMLYDQVRNYLTKKMYSKEKIKLNFNTPTLAGGWDRNKELDNSTFILRKYNEIRDDYDYFIGIWNTLVPKKVKVTPYDENGTYQKMNYKFFPDPSKMLPKLFRSKAWLKDNPISDEFDKKYTAGLHKKGDDFDLEFLHELIDNFKYGLENHPNEYQKTFNFKLKPTKDYKTYTEFIHDVQQSNYKVNFEPIADVTDLVNEGNLFLFQIWSKDFSEFSKGRKNLNTIYFESLFSKENLEDAIFKLSGGAELFYRPASIKYSDEKRKKGHHYEQLKDSFSYPILKDKRYSLDKFFFHAPITINYRAEGLSPKKFNEKIQDNITDFTHIIGIDRGERHLVYLSVVNILTGEIVEQKHLDEIINIDKKQVAHKTSYLKKLEERSEERDYQRKSWESIETIKELKEGYISQLVNEIRKMQEKYNALIVFENLNTGFKNSRIKIEKQIYQKFEVALIKKLNYLIDKGNPETYRHGLQLTNPLNTLSDIGTQTGVVFYISAWNTSNIDPVTGFVNLFYADDLRYKSMDQVHQFMEKIDRIYMEDGLLKFDIDFSKWNNRYPNTKRKWTLTSYGTRIATFRNPDKLNNWDSKEVDLTERFKEILNSEGKLKAEDAATGKEFMRLFKLMVTLRQSITGTDLDYILSPVANSEGIQFDSRNSGSELPTDADANGAYNIARKGLMVVDRIKNNVAKPFYITNEEYLRQIQGLDADTNN